MPIETVMIALNGQGKTRGTVAYLLMETTCNQSLAGILPSNHFDSLYLYYFLDASYEELRNINGEGRNGLNLNLIKEFKVILPLLSEQKKIAEILFTIDKQIEGTKQLIEKTKELKKGLIKQLLAKGIGHTEFKQSDIGEIPVDWHIKQLKDISEFQNGKAHENIVDKEGQFILVNSKFISTEGKVAKTVSENIMPLMKKDIAIVMSDLPNGKAIAKCFLITENDKYTLNQRIGLIRTRSLQSEFLYYQLNRNTYFLKFDDGVSQTNLKKSDILECPIIVPPLEEQQKIAEILSTVDAEIESYAQEKTKYEELKKGLMQQLLTGQLRVKV